MQVENAVRWRKIKDDEGNEILDEFEKPMRESNARVVRWSDGRSVELLLVILLLTLYRNLFY